MTYAFLLKALYSGWIKAVADLHVAHTSEFQFVSVLVPFRNEAENIPRLLDTLFSQNYPRGMFEVILINDHSTDDSLQIIEDKIKHATFSTITIVHASKSGKKSALTEGVKLAKGSIILTTDADCEVGRNWIISFNPYFKADEVKLVFGAVKIVPNESIFQKMQSIEFASLIGSGAATMSLGVPTMCNGANLAFRKEVFEQVKGYEGNLEVSSGDDEFLMRKIHAAYPASIRFNASGASIVSTLALASLKAFAFQRIRWAGKWKHHHDIKSKLLALYLFTFHLLIVSLPFFTLLGYIEARFIVVLFVVKAVLEFRLLHRVTSWLQIGWHWPSFILLQLVYSFYVVFVGLVSTFLRPEWKGRRV